MLTKNELKDIQNLRRAADRKARGVFIVEGPKMVRELIAVVPERIEAIYATHTWQGPGNLATEISEAELSKISQLSTPNQVIAIVHQVPPVLPPADAFVLYLDAIQDPGNLGTIIRTADWFGVKHLVCSLGCADVYSSKVVQATMSSIVRVNVFTDEHEDWLAGQQRPVYAASLNGKPISGNQAIAGAVLIIGNESKGIREEFLALATEKITIPKFGQAESLNAAVATGILLAQLVGVVS